MSEAPSRPDQQYRIEELAREAGIPVRTLRYYQERRLLPPPRREGRVALYSPAHLERLRLITALLERGYRLDGIEELLAAWEQGRDVGELLGFEWAVTAPWSDETVFELSVDELAAMFGDQFTPEALEEAVELGYLEVDGDRVRHRIPRLLEATAALVQEGVPLSAILAVTWELEAAFDRMAYVFVRMARRHLLGPVGTPPSPAELARLTRTVERLRPVARTVADEHFARAMDRRIRRELPVIAEHLPPAT
ncbi:MAG TPA: MerR family transcriptional regulator [Thermomonospora sp.]|nr:MerR family transcriptional regulator [Thermomonospora sp.]